MQRKTIVMTCNTSFGLANFRLGLIRRLLDEGHKVVGVAPRDKYSAQLIAAGVEFHPWPLNARSANPLREIYSLWKLLAIYQSVRPDVCFHYTVKPIIYGAVAARILRIDCVSVITGLGYAFLHRGLIPGIVRSLYKLVLNTSYRVWFLNPTDADDFISQGLVKPAIVEVVPGEGVDTAHFSRSSAHLVDAPIDFLVIARLLRDKGILEFVEALQLLRANGLRFTAKIVGGSGEDNPTSIDPGLVADWTREGLLEYLGIVGDVRPFLERAKCVVLPSYREGIPRALLEAASMQVPVVTTDVPGCRDVVSHGVTGFLCEVKSAVALAHAMEQLLALDADARAAMGAAGRGLVECLFSEHLIVKRYMAVLTDQHPDFTLAQGDFSKKSGID